MNWSSYEVFAVLGGLVMLAAAAVPVVEMKERLIFAAFGVGFIGYGIYVASQEYGTFTFPVFIYIFPVGAVIRAGLAWHEHRVAGTSAPGADDPT